MIFATSFKDRSIFKLGSVDPNKTHTECASVCGASFTDFKYPRG